MITIFIGRPYDPNISYETLLTEEFLKRVRIFYKSELDALEKNLLLTVLIVSGLALFCLPGCDVMVPTASDSVHPALSDLMIPSVLYLQTDMDYPVSVKVTDPQGNGDIRTVNIYIFPEDNTVLLTDTMADDGSMGDIIPKDGIYSYGLKIDFAGQVPGSYRAAVVARDHSDHLSDTLFTSLIVEEGELNLAPELSDPVVPDTLREEDLQDIFLSIRASDPQGLPDLDSVFFHIYPYTSPVPYFTGILADRGTAGDPTAGDGIFCARFRLVTLLGGRPVLADLTAPALISRSDGEPVLLSIRVSDAQGLGDIKAVYFNTTKPDGQSASGNPFFMYDSGDKANHGDETANDGIYSLLIQITPENQTGDYRFDFFAEDFSQGADRCLIRFQSRDRDGLLSHPVVAESITRFNWAVSDSISHVISVVE
jgi:hypothetical protein